MAPTPVCDGFKRKEEHTVHCVFGERECLILRVNRALFAISRFYKPFINRILLNNQHLNGVEIPIAIRRLVAV